eukprot:evm.model.NODE_38800_length_23839_cov_28.586224.2
MQESYLTSLKEVTTTSSSAISPVAVGGGKEKKKVVVIGAGWGGLSAAFELAKRSDEYDVTLLEAGPSVGGLVAGWKTQGKEKQGEGGDETMKAGGGEVRQDDRLIDFFQAKDRRIHFFHVKEDHPH